VLHEVGCAVGIENIQADIQAASKGDTLSPGEFD
jgi:hypothetical protein